MLNTFISLPPPFTTPPIIFSSSLTILQVVQVEVGFFWHEGLCETGNTSLVKFDVFIDCFFVVEIMLKFFTGVWMQGTYHDRLNKVAYQYATTSLCFDCLTSMPVTVMEFLARQNFCDSRVEESAVMSEYIHELKIMRALKPLRVFKLLKLARAGNVIELLNKMDHLIIMPVFLTRMLRAWLAMLFAVHSCACLYWLVKESTCTQEEFDDFLLNINYARTNLVIQIVQQLFTLTCSLAPSPSPSRALPLERESALSSHAQ